MLYLVSARSQILHWNVTVAVYSVKMSTPNKWMFPPQAKVLHQQHVTAWIMMNFHKQSFLTPPPLWRGQLPTLKTSAVGFSTQESSKSGSGRCSAWCRSFEIFFLVFLLHKFKQVNMFRWIKLLNKSLEARKLSKDTTLKFTDFFVRVALNITLTRTHFASYTWNFELPLF